MEGGGKKNDELNVFVRLKKECNRRGGRTDTPSGASWGPHSTATTKATRHHHLPARTTTSVASPSWIERGASVRASLPSSGPSRHSLSPPFLSLLLRRRARSTYLCNETIPHFCSPPPRSSSSMRWQRRCCQVMHATREKKKRRSRGPAEKHHGMSSESFYLLRGGRGRGFRGRRGININSRGSIVRRAAGQTRHHTRALVVRRNVGL